MSKANDEGELLGCVILFIAAILIGIFVAGYWVGVGAVGRHVGRDEMKAEAVNAGVAEWVVNGDKQMEFKWKTGK